MEESARTDPVCDFCDEERAFLYCKADSARLCLACDYQVHGANALSLKHNRTAVCDQCVSRAASVRCEEESIFLCQDCDDEVHGEESRHNRTKLKPYSCCPSATELGHFWGSFLAAIPDGGSSFELCNPDNGTGAGFDSSLFNLEKRLSGGWTCSPVTDGSLNCVVAGHRIARESDDHYFWNRNVDSSVAPNDGARSFMAASSSIIVTEGAGERQINYMQMFLRQLDQLQKLQSESAETAAGLHPEVGQHNWSKALTQLPSFLTIGLDAQAGVKVHQQQKFPAEQEFGYVSLLLSDLEQTKSTKNECPWSRNVRSNSIQILEAESCKKFDKHEGLDMAHTSLVIDNNRDSVPTSKQMLPIENQGCVPCVSKQRFTLGQKPYDSTPDIFFSKTPFNNHATRKWDVVLPPALSGSGSPQQSPRNVSKDALTTHLFQDVSVSDCERPSEFKLPFSSPKLPRDFKTGNSLDNGSSPASFKVDASWVPTSPDVEALVQARDNAMMRYKEKKKTRKYEKCIRYASRKARADIRQRVRGRFVKADADLNCESVLVNGIS